MEHIEDWKERLEIIREQRSDWHRSIPKGVKCCYNCKYMAWLVGVGQGIRCIIDKGDRPGSQIRGLMESCSFIELKQSQKKS
jgi:hypothetical protein